VLGSRIAVLTNFSFRRKLGIAYFAVLKASNPMVEYLMEASLASLANISATTSSVSIVLDSPPRILSIDIYVLAATCWLRRGERYQLVHKAVKVRL